MPESLPEQLTMKNVTMPMRTQRATNMTKMLPTIVSQPTRLSPFFSALDLAVSWVSRLVLDLGELAVDLSRPLRAD